MGEIFGARHALFKVKKKKKKWEEDWVALGDGGRKWRIRGTWILDRSENGVVWVLINQLRAANTGRHINMYLEIQCKWKKKIVVGFIGLIIMSTYWCYNCPRYGYLQHNIM